MDEISRGIMTAYFTCKQAHSGSVAYHHDCTNPFGRRKCFKGCASVIRRPIFDGLSSATPDNEWGRSSQPNVLAASHFGNSEYSLPQHDILSFFPMYR